MSRLDNQLERLEAMSPAELGAEWVRVWKAPAPRLSPALLRLGLAYRLQEKALGPLPKSVTRALKSAAPVPTIKPGTQLVRSWNGRTLNVLVTERGYVLDGTSFSSLSAIAREVTGAAWSGPRFFGLNARG